MRLPIHLLAACLFLASAGCSTVPVNGGWPGRPPADSDAPEPVNMTRLERDVIDELNLARTRPGRYADILRERLSTFEGAEGTAAVEEAIRELERIAPRAPLEPSAGLAAAAQDHVADQGPRGGVGHTGSDGSDPFSRIRRYVDSNGTAENISYGYRTARDVVAALLIDDGVPGRGHRKNILNPDYAHVGVAHGSHARFGTMTVMDFSIAIEE